MSEIFEEYQAKLGFYRSKYEDQDGLNYDQYFDSNNFELILVMSDFMDMFELNEDQVEEIFRVLEKAEVSCFLTRVKKSV